MAQNRLVIWAVNTPTMVLIHYSIVFSFCFQDKKSVWSLRAEVSSLIIFCMATMISVVSIIFVQVGNNFT